ncbi:MAG: TolC family protein, partial [Gammaproteobacteria bacterium]|nr:TolC family protein [Gammaproteobacteria bacterium]
MRSCWLALAVAILLPGCAQYHARPLRKPALAALKAPSAAQLRAQALRLRAPFAVTRLDFRKPLTGTELGIISVLANPALRALRAHDRIAHAQVFNAGLLPDPVIQYQALRPYGPRSAGRSTSLADGFLWDLSALVTHAATVRVARFHARSVEAQVAWQEWVMANRTRIAAIHVYWLRRQRALALATLPLWRRAHRWLAADVRSGVVAPARLVLWQAAYQHARAQTWRLARAATIARMALDADLGLPPATHPL